MLPQDIEHRAPELSEPERATLILSLIDTLVAPGTEVSDEEVRRRDAELATGAVQPMLHEEFGRRVCEDRGG